MFDQIYGLAVSLLVFFGIIFFWGVVWAEETDIQLIMKKIIFPIVLVFSILPFLGSFAYLSFWQIIIVMIIFALALFFSVLAGVLYYGKGRRSQIVGYLFLVLFCWAGIVFLIFNSASNLS